MNFIDVFFIVFCSIVVLSVFGILFTKNVIHAVLLLVICLLSIAAIFVLLNAQFVAVVQILVYAGGVVILLAFGIMLTNRPTDERLITSHQWVYPGIVISGLLFFLLAKTQSSFVLPGLNDPGVVDQVKTIGVGFMTENILAFELVAILLLVVLVGAAFLAKRYMQS